MSYFYVKFYLFGSIILQNWYIYNIMIMILHDMYQNIIIIEYFRKGKVTSKSFMLSVGKQSI